MDNLQANYYYHIYNRGINSCNLFEDENNYTYFLKLYEKYINNIADTYAWVLMPNHFHLLVRIKHPTGFRNLSGVEEKLTKPPHQYFSNLFNAYTKAFNKYHNRHGALFERPFRRKLIDSEDYLRQLILYIHNNPVHHGFTNHPIEYGWSSYQTCVSEKETKLKRNKVISCFNDINNFEYCHNNSIDIEEINNYLGI
ncbi:transposase [Saccharicrinis aurantiacus]|uniref:transposase n=1 Tax=Saccharicrinis aurantiacus TaxID=1849719 RepID=UPI00248FBB33|nr:transposase [Saccharicrinis aurantiacus]